MHKQEGTIADIDHGKVDNAGLRYKQEPFNPVSSNKDTNDSAGNVK